MQTEHSLPTTTVNNLELSINPAPLGLPCLRNDNRALEPAQCRFFALGSMILAMGIFYGGLTQVLNKTYKKTVAPI
ncbi:MAG: hypothetical protein WC342_01010 [Methanoregula sp.]|jgi:hypothetical protein